LAYYGVVPGRCAGLRGMPWPCIRAVLRAFFWARGHILALDKGPFRGDVWDSGHALAMHRGPFLGTFLGTRGIALGMHRGCFGAMYCTRGHALALLRGHSGGDARGMPVPCTGAVLVAFLGPQGHALALLHGRFGAFLRTQGHAWGCFTGDTWGSGARLGHAPELFWWRCSGCGGMHQGHFGAMCGTWGRVLAMHWGRFRRNRRDSGACLCLTRGRLGSDVSELGACLGIDVRDMVHQYGGTWHDTA